MNRVEAIRDGSYSFELVPPISIPDGIPVTGLEQVLSIHLANKRNALPIAGLVAEQLLAATSFADGDPVLRASILSQLCENDPVVRAL